MQSLTPTVVPASGPKPSPRPYVGWLLAIIAIPATAFLILGVASAVDREWGIVGVVLGLALFPVTMVVMPFHAGFVRGEWMLTGLVAGLVAAAWLFELRRDSSLEQAPSAEDVD